MTDVSCDNSAEVRIGVTGHRVLMDLEKVRAGVAEAVRRVEEAFPGRSLTALSSLAEGAGRIVAQAVLARGGTLQAVLPLPVDDYLQDFTSEGSRDEFAALLARAARTVMLPTVASRTAAYVQEAAYLVEHSDVFIAIYDGRPAQGPGGTGEVVALAQEHGLPIVYVKAGNRKLGTEEPTTLGEEQGRIVIEGP